MYVYPVSALIKKPLMARPKSAEHELKRTEILDRAAECFAANSYVAASMNDIAAACGTSKARLYHYYASKDAILFDLLDRYTERLLLIVEQVQAEHKTLDARDALHTLIRHFLAEYESSATRHIALVSHTPFLPEAERALITQKQREIVAAFARFIKRAYPKRVSRRTLTPLTMMLFGMMNWTFTWLKPADKNSPNRITYAAFAELIIDTLEKGFS
jgi:AcrR family transcriptional regulator